jgi:polyribonucleotide nucleotidyltransferase
MIGDITATAEVGKTYLGKVVRLADFGAFVEIFPGTDGLLHISEVAEHRIRDVRDELNEGDQILVKVLSVEGNRIRLSRKAILKEQRAKMGEASGEAPAPVGSMTIEGGEGSFEEEESGEPNFNRDAPMRSERPEGPPSGRPSGGPGGGGRRRRGGRGGRGRGPGGPGGRGGDGGGRGPGGPPRY